jgi:hypothetical protein
MSNEKQTHIDSIQDHSISYRFYRCWKQIENLFPVKHSYFIFLPLTKFLRKSF